MTNPYADRLYTRLESMEGLGHKPYLLVGIEGRGEEDHPNVAFFVLDEDMVTQLLQTRAAALSVYNQARLDGRPIPVLIRFAGRFQPAFGTDLPVYVPEVLAENCRYGVGIDEGTELDRRVYQTHLWVYTDREEAFYTLEADSMWLDIDSVGNIQFVARVDGMLIEGNLPWHKFAIEVCPTCGGTDLVAEDADSHLFFCRYCYNQGAYPSMFIAGWPLEVEND